MNKSKKKKEIMKVCPISMFIIVLGKSVSEKWMRKK